MRLYVSNGYLEDAAVITIEFISAVLGHGKEYFGLETSLQANAPPVWLPHNTIDLIMLELKDHAAADQTYKQVRYESISSPFWLQGRRETTKLAFRLGSQCVLRYTSFLTETLPG